MRRGSTLSASGWRQSKCEIDHTRRVADVLPFRCCRRNFISFAVVAGAYRATVRTVREASDGQYQGSSQSSAETRLVAAQRRAQIFGLDGLRNERNQPDLADPDMTNWAKCLRAEAEAGGFALLDPSKISIEESVDHVCERLRIGRSRG